MSITAWRLEQRIGRQWDLAEEETSHCGNRLQLQRCCIFPIQMEAKFSWGWINFVHFFQVSDMQCLNELLINNREILLAAKIFTGIPILFKVWKPTSHMSSYDLLVCFSGWHLVLNSWNTLIVHRQTGTVDIHFKKISTSVQGAIFLSPSCRGFCLADRFCSIHHHLPSCSSLSRKDK